ncbi:MAG: hypothetical protein LBR67_00955 [Dysgonamonadaceae bacterium]|jgi:hypothetical protein|nr:hypothetical protein [Dysgonamonadaceae bacterium]
MTYQEILDKLTPDRFKNGETFDIATFNALKGYYLEVRKIAWVPFVLMAALFGLGFLFSFGIGGFVGNMIAVVIFISVMPVSNIPLYGYSKKIKNALQSLGLTQKEFNDEIKCLKNELKG